MIINKSCSISKVYLILTSISSSSSRWSQRSNISILISKSNENKIKIEIRIEVRPMILEKGRGWNVFCRSARSLMIWM